MQLESLFSGVRWIFEGRRRLLVNRILARVPLGHHAFLFESCELAAVVYRCRHLPEHEQREPDQHYRSDHAEHYAQDGDLLRTFSFFLRSDDPLARFIK